MSNDQPGTRPINWTRWIMVAVLVWGGYLAIGALRAGGNQPSLRGLIVFACTLVFLGLWWVALVLRARRMRIVDGDGEE